MRPWDAAYPPECRWDVPIRTGTLPGFLDDVASRFAALPALEYRGHVLPMMSCATGRIASRRG